MDELQTKLQNQHATVLYPKDDPTVVLFGKSEMSRSYKDGKEYVNESYCITQGIDRGDPEPDISSHHIHNYENVKKWIDENLDISYDKLLEKFKAGELG